MDSDSMAKIRRAMQDPDRFVVRIKYVDSKLRFTDRVVSPIRIEGNAVLALCLGRQENRTFSFDGIANVELVSADEVLMPEPIRETK